MPLDERLLDILACPVDKGPLLYFADAATLYNPRLHRLYGIESDVPLMRADQARAIPDEQHQDLLTAAAAGQALATLGGTVRAVLDAVAEDADTGVICAPERR